MVTRITFVTGWVDSLGLKLWIGLDMKDLKKLMSTHGKLIEASEEAKQSITAL